MFENTLAITVIFIVLATVVGAFIKRRQIDRCLKDFAGYSVTVELTAGKAVWGKLRPENTGLELVYDATYKDEDGHNETSYILYKQEYSNIQALLRFHHQLNAADKKRRDCDLNRTYHPGSFRRLGRRTKNVFKAIRDSIMEVINVLITHAKKTTPAGTMLTSQDKYVSQIKQEIATSVGTAYEPLLEKHIGKMVVLELVKGDKILEIVGVLKDYTSEFIELMDIDYRLNPADTPQKADIVALRRLGIVRHLAE
ncbi:MAG: hypothetical protein K8R02_00650 [Anaerohalosphaeraceae bacterium]|nr:hypothetical protein [Anaerohalosphaeraceae bacterium]